MKKVLKIFSIIILVIMLISQYTLISNAANEENQEKETKISLKTQNSQIQSNSEIKVYIYLESTKETDGIALVEGKIEYDSEKLEPITTNDSTYNGWNTTWNTENGSITIDRGNLTSTPQEIAQLTFKVKEGATKGDTNIAFKEISVSDGFSDETIEETVNLKLTITEAETENPGNEEDNKQEQEKPSNGNSDGNNNNGDSNNNDGDKKEEEQQKPAVDNNNNSNGSSSNNKDSGTSEKAESAAATNNKTNNESLPKTGMNQWMIGATGIILVLGIVSYIKYKKYKNI